MSIPIEDYALLSNCRTAALVSREGSIDWLCVPRLDSGSVFGALLGDEDHGCWGLRPVDATATATRQYDGDTLLLVTRWEGSSGVAEVHDIMPIGKHGSVGEDRVDIVRRVVGIKGLVEFDHTLRMRFDYARAMPWVRQIGTDETPELVAMAGPDAIVLRGARAVASDHVHTGKIAVAEGQSVDLMLTWFPSHHQPPERLDVDDAVEHTRTWWQEWADKIVHDGPHRPEVVRSLLILRGLTNHVTGGIAAAVTTSLPEDFGGVRNWDYRYVWLRDAALTLEALLDHGFIKVAAHWREWLLRAVAGDPADLQIMYGLAGERDLAEREMPSLPGYADSAPVRVGNGAALQYQADVIGEVLVTLAAARDAGLNESAFSWPLEKKLVAEAARQLDRPDNGLWEIRGEPHMFTHSRVMVWATFDRAVRAVEVHGLEGPVEKWRELRTRVKNEIDEHGVTDGHFTQYYGTTEVDASLLLLPQVGFCAPDDPRMLATVTKIESDLLQHGLLRRYRNATGVDGLPGAEYPFLACSFWLVEQYAATGRLDEARALMDRLCGLVNDVGMLSEEYDIENRRQAGNTPQAFSHLALVRAADALSRARHKPR
ncbi:glycoside hydrolase family 15 protein [Microbacterium horticulturae]|uniref:Glycoside hydrolase family 15 protein n=1 Tax=Microbacterium horticulturae TaxID=3028316 RepID=A0ABY8BWK0_9MICO|nr:glycoside hydrolase family 15 protein [Microbacterium sp. KACC 23027]WEG08541.1 glycoside hydrolase family 15 protein [Microbacterium sp. KACC 23027]